MLSIVVSWKNRKEIAETIGSLFDSAEEVDGEVIIVNFDGDALFLKNIIEPYRSRVREVQVAGQTLFNKAASNNIGAYCAKNEYIFFCDCDIILGQGTVKSLLGLVSEDRKYFGTLEGVRETVVNSIQNNHIVSFGYKMIIKTRDGRELQIVDSEEDATDGTRNAPGLLITSRLNFESVNGYNSNLVGWGWEDQDMISRLTLGAGLTRLFHGKALHVSHNDHERTKHYPISNRWESRDKMFRQALANYDSNNFLGTWREDLERIRFGQ